LKNSKAQSARASRRGKLSVSVVRWALLILRPIKEFEKLKSTKCEGIPPRET